MGTPARARVPPNIMADKVETVSSVPRDSVTSGAPDMANVLSAPGTKLPSPFVTLSDGRQARRRHRRHRGGPARRHARHGLLRHGQRR